MLPKGHSEAPNNVHDKKITRSDRCQKCKKNLKQTRQTQRLHDWCNVWSVFGDPTYWTYVESTMERLTLRWPKMKRNWTSDASMPINELDQTTQWPYLIKLISKVFKHIFQSYLHVDCFFASCCSRTSSSRSSSRFSIAIHNCRFTYYCTTTSSNCGCRCSSFVDDVRKLFLVRRFPRSSRSMCC